MVHAEQFIYGLFNGTGYRLIKSRGVDKLLSNRQLQYLCHIGDGVSEEAVVQIRLGDILSISVVRPVKDTYGRSGVWNHTILMDMNAYLVLSQPSSFLTPYFIRSLDRPVERLDVLQIE